MRGGAISIDPKQPSIVGVFNMLRDAVSITLISDSSLYGFTFMVEIDKGKAQFKSVTAGEEGELIKILIKLTILTSGINDEKILVFGNQRKDAQTISSFQDEIEVQKKVFKETQQSGGLAITPSIIYHHICHDINESRSFLNYFSSLKLKFTPTAINNAQNKINTILNFLIDNINIESRSLGIIFMEFVDTNNNFLLYNYFREPITQELLVAYLSSIIILYHDCGIIHADLHGGNFFVNSSNNKVRIIDFGRIKKVESKKIELTNLLNDINEILKIIQRVIIDKNQLLNNYLNKKPQKVTEQMIKTYLQKYYDLKATQTTYIDLAVEKIGQRDVLKESFIGNILRNYLHTMKDKITIDTNDKFSASTPLSNEDNTNIRNINEILVTLDDTIPPIEITQSQ